MELRSLARQQHGVVTRTQALAAGLSPEAIRWRLARGHWSRVHPGVYQTHTGELGWIGRASAAILRLGDGSALGMGSAAYLLGIEDVAPPILTVLVPHARQRTRVPGSRVARRRRLVTTVRRGLRVTTAAETVIDMAGGVGATRRDAVAVAARAVQRRRTTADELLAALGERRAHPHRRALELGLGVVGLGAESGLEVRFHQTVLVAHGLPPMRLAVPDVSDGQAVRRDFEEVEYGVVVEVDGRVTHGAAERERDNRRDRRVARSGRVTLRAGWVDVEFEPCELALDLHGALVNRGYRGPIRACGPRCRAVAHSSTRPA